MPDSWSPNRSLTPTLWFFFFFAKSNFLLKPHHSVPFGDGAFLRTWMRARNVSCLSSGPKRFSVAEGLGLGVRWKDSDKLRLILEMFYFAHSFIRSSNRHLLSAQCLVQRWVRGIQCRLAHGHGLIFQELGVWWGSGQCEGRRRLFYCIGKGTHLVLLAIWKMRKTQVAPNGLMNKWYISDSSQSPV